MKDLYESLVPFSWPSWKEEETDDDSRKRRVRKDRPPTVPQRKPLQDDLISIQNCSYVNCLVEVPGLLLSDSEEDYNPDDELTAGFSRLTMRKSASVWDNDSDDDENDFYYPTHTHVEFTTASVREYAVTVGDHPGCSGALPLTLDWLHSAEKVYAIEEYEVIKRLRPRGRRRYTGRPRKLDFWKRRAVLQEVGPLAQTEADTVVSEVELHSDVSLEDDTSYDAMDEEESSLLPSCDGGENVLEMEFGFRFPVMTVQVLEG